MSQFYGSVMTSLGADLLTKALAGTATIEFTSFVTGDGSYSEAERETSALMARTALKSQKQSVAFQSVTRPTSTSVVLDATVDNSALASGYYVREIGIYAQNTLDATPTPILYAIAVAEVADYMPPYNGLLPVTITEQFIATVNNSASITVQTTGAYASATDLGNVADLNTTDKSNVVNAVNEVLGVARNVVADGAGAHNAIYRGKNLGTEVTAEQYAAILNGKFTDMFIGDYWVINSVTWRIGCFDYWLHCGDTECTDHHILIVPDQNLDTQKMNDSNVTTGAYVGSKMYTANMATAKGKVTAAFGSAHILTHREYLQNAVTSGYASAGAWYDSDIELMTQQMVYGNMPFNPGTALGQTIPALYTIGKSQLPLFALEPSRICNRASWWVRDVVSATYFAFVSADGDCYYGGASGSLGVRSAFAIKA